MLTIRHTESVLTAEVGGESDVPVVVVQKILGSKVYRTSAEDNVPGVVVEVARINLRWF